MAHQPDKYNRAFSFGVTERIRCVVRFDKPAGIVSRFVVQLQRLDTVSPQRWETFAQTDHDPGNPKGHDLYAEGLHIDVYHGDGTTSTLNPSAAADLPTPPIVLMHACKDYLCDNVDYFYQAAMDQIVLNQPPNFS